MDSSQSEERETLTLNPAFLLRLFCDPCLILKSFWHSITGQGREWRQVFVSPVARMALKACEHFPGYNLTSLKEAFQMEGIKLN